MASRARLEGSGTGSAVTSILSKSHFSESVAGKLPLKARIIALLKVGKLYLPHCVRFYVALVICLIRQVDTLSGLDDTVLSG